MSDLNEHHLARALVTDILFCSELATGDAPTGPELAVIVRQALKAHWGWDGRTRAVATAFDKMPASAAEREAWSLKLAEDALKSAEVLAELSQME